MNRPGSRWARRYARKRMRGQGSGKRHAKSKQSTLKVWKRLHK